MSRAFRLISLLAAVLCAAALISACGQEKISIPRSDPNYASDYASAQIFHERCGGCHTLSYAAAGGSGNNPRTYLTISGPNFNVRCERPAARVLYAIENGGFSGAYMPANIIVGAQAKAMALFISRFAGRKAPVQPDTTPCEDLPIGPLPTSPTGGVNIPNTTGASSGTESASSSTGGTLTTALATTVTKPKKSKTKSSY